MFSGFRPSAPAQVPVGTEPLLDSAQGGERWSNKRGSRLSRLSRRGSIKKLTPAERMHRYVESAASMSEGYSPQCAGCLRSFNPFFAMMLQFLVCAVQLYAKLYTHAYSIYKQLPADQIQMIVGLVLCFFGGTYVALIAAVEAFRTMGGEQLWEDLDCIWDHILVIWERHKLDDGRDDDNDGIADVDQIPASELWKRKLRLALVAVDEPTVLQSAIGSLWSACLGVLATLKLQFAQTVGYALAISEMVGYPMCRLFGPALGWMLGSELKHWVETIITTAVMVVCVLLVWWMQKVRAAFYSGIRGGRVFADALIDLLEQRKLLSRVPASLVSFNEEGKYDADESHLDEIIAYPLAMLGFGFQVSSFFMLPFPLDWVLWPVSMVETFLELQISWSW